MSLDQPGYSWCFTLLTWPTTFAHSTPTQQWRLDSTLNHIIEAVTIDASQCLDFGYCCHFVSCHFRVDLKVMWPLHSSWTSSHFLYALLLIIIEHRRWWRSLQSTMIEAETFTNQYLWLIMLNSWQGWAVTQTVPIKRSFSLPAWKLGITFWNLWWIYAISTIKYSSIRCHILGNELSIRDEWLDCSTHPFNNSHPTHARVITNRLWCMNHGEPWNMSGQFLTFDSMTGRSKQVWLDVHQHHSNWNDFQSKWELRFSYPKIWCIIRLSDFTMMTFRIFATSWAAQNDPWIWMVTKGDLYCQVTIANN